jgi:excisionase family DNA binding protein
MIFAGADSSSSAPSTQSDFLTVRQAARLFRVSPGWLRAEIRSGRLSGYRKGQRWVRVSESELIAHLRSHRVKPASAEQAEYARRRVAEIMEGK